MILFIDNYDSFTYNLVQAFGEILPKIRNEEKKVKGGGIKIFRNDEIALAKAKALRPTHLVISPGPKRPEDAGISSQFIEHFAGQIPVLGVCLGHQCLSHVFGGKVILAQAPVHGKTSQVYHDNQTIFKGLPNPFQAMRYHSLIVDARTLPKCFEVSAWTSAGEIMGIRIKDRKVEGVQFHPESYLTPEGRRLLKNFLSL